MKTGILNLRHLHSNGTAFASVMPRKHTVSISRHVYQDIMPQSPPDMTYPDYALWLDECGYVEKTSKGEIRPLIDEYLASEQAESNRVIGRPDQMDIFKFIEN